MADPAPQSPTPSETVLIRGRAFVPVPLTQLRPGDRARLHAEGLRCEACDLLNAMGLTEQCELRVCKVGEPCIVQVNETRVGISGRLARQILVTPVGTAPAGRAPAADASVPSPSPSEKAESERSAPAPGEGSQDAGGDSGPARRTHAA